MTNSLCNYRYNFFSWIVQICVKCPLSWEPTLPIPRLIKHSIANHTKGCTHRNMYLPNISTQIFQPGQTMEIMETKSRLCNSHCRRDGISLLFCHFWIQNQFITRSVQNQLVRRRKLSDWSTIDNSPFSSEPQSPDCDCDSFWEHVVNLTECLKHIHTTIYLCTPKQRAQFL